MNSTISVTNVIDAFKQRGFDYIGKANDGWFRLRGKLNPRHSDRRCPCEVELDPDFLDIPRIRLLEIPPELPAAVPHLGADGALCYLAKGTVVLDIFDPVGQSIACLERAESVFGQIMKSEMVDDLAEEFYAYWNGPYCMVDIEGKDLGRQVCTIGEKNNILMWFITDNAARTSEKMSALGYQSTDMTTLTYRVKTTVQPRPLNNWPPKTVRDILEWQGKLDSNCRRKIAQRIQQGLRKKAQGVLILIESPLMTYAFAVLFAPSYKAPRRKLINRRCSILDFEVTLLSVARIDNKYLAERNIPNFKTLAGKKIAVVGCGTIGGYLAEMLVKSGAGSLGGKLTLVDLDVLLPQNIGRHRLGFPDLFANKSIAVANEMNRLAPGIDVCGLPVDVRQAQLGEQDLLIDASGEESLGHWLCRTFLPSTTMLSVWIEGPGTAIRGLLKVHEATACYRCLWHSNRKGELQTVVDPIPHILAGHGCEGQYVPFPASVSVQAASLGLEMALDWVNNVYSPSLRTKLIDSSHLLATPDCDPLRDNACPICNP